MLYPVFSYSDGTEVTASKPDLNGDILLYIEKFDEQNDCFINATISLKDMKVIESHGYTGDELDHMVKKYTQIRYDIIGYIMDKEKISA